MPRASYTLCDVFTDGPLSGNQLAVLAEEGVADSDRLPLAREFGFSEVTFLAAPRADGDVPVRIFTPARELAFAGHPLLGSAAVAGHGTRAAQVRLRPPAGPMPVQLQWTGERDVLAWMSQPVPRELPVPRPGALLAALGVGQVVLDPVGYDNGVAHILVGLGTAAQVAGLRPDLPALEAALDGLAAGVSCFAADGAGWKTRMFGPALGVAEDAATGSAAGPLACHLLRHGLVEPDRELQLRQGAEIGRPSVLLARVTGEPARVDQVWVGGAVHLLGTGELVW